MNVWQLQDAKNRLSEVVKRACEEGPQSITVRSLPTAVVISVRDFEALTKPRMSFVDFLLVKTSDAPLWSDDVVDAINTRSDDAGRDIEF